MYPILEKSYNEIKCTFNRSPINAPRYTLKGSFASVQDYGIDFILCFRYRDFPKVDSAHLPIEIHRKYSCNFLGTVYRNSSREKLVETLKEGQYQDMCYVRARYE